MLEKKPLSEPEKEQLTTIYDQRLRLFVIINVIFVVLALIYSSENIHNIDDYGHPIPWKKNDDHFNLSATQMYFTSLSFLGYIIVGTGLIIFFKRINPFKQDLKCGEKEIVPYLITRKEYFPITNQYFVALDDPDYLHHEIDEDTYNQCTEGGYLFLSRAIHSGYVFEINGRFSLM